MRFGNGAWRMLDDVRSTWPARVDGYEISEKSLVLHVSDRMEDARWATLEGHMFTITFTSPLEGVIRYTLEHYKGRLKKGPNFELALEPQKLAVQDKAESFEILSGSLKVVITKRPWAVQYFDAKSGELISSSPFKALGLMDKTDHGTFVREQLTLKPGEQLYGLGERFSAFSKMGQSVDMWNADCGTCSDKGYKDVPFFLSNRGWGVLVNNSGKVSFELGTEQVERASFSVKGEDLDYLFFYGKGEPKEVLNLLGAVSGRPALPPAWSFGLWLTTSFTTNYDEKTVTGFVDGMKERNIPLHVFHFDCFWMKGNHWVNFTWDNETFPDPEGMLSRMHNKGLKLCVWINPYIAERSHLFDEGMAKGYLLKRPNGDVYQRHMWQAGMGFVDFTNPEAVRWYQEKLRVLLKMGVDCFKTDFGEEIPTDVAYFDGSDAERMHNYYTYLYNKCVFDLLLEERGEGEAVLFARSATATCQQFPVHWGGDCFGTYESMAESLRGGLSLTLSGFGYWSHDIGGFESMARPEVYKRWVAFGLMSSHSRLHGSTSYRVPWLYDEEAVDVVRFFTNIKCRMMPYLLRASLEAHTKNLPVMRAMLLEYPEDPSCRSLDRQYMLGSDLLVSPVLDDTTAEYYLPAGEWVNFLTGEVRSGSRWFTETQDFMSLPLWIRPNGIIPLSPEKDLVDYDYAKDLSLVCGKFDGSSSKTLEVADGKGKILARFELSQKDKTVSIKSLEGKTDFTINLPWAKSVSGLTGAKEVETLKLPGTAGGISLKAQAASLSFTWA